MEGEETCARVLLQNGADVSTAIASGSTVLHLACWCGHEVCARLLLQHGCDVSAVDLYGQTSLHNACGPGHEGCARLLLQLDINLAAVTSDSKTVHAMHVIVTMLRDSCGEVGLHDSNVQAQALLLPRILY